MADLGDTFDPTAIPEDERSFEPMPAGDYLCQVVDSELIDLKSGNGQALKLTIEVVEGQFANRKVWDNLNIRHTNATAQSIAQRSLADLCLAIGVGAIRDSEELHFRPFIATLKIETREGYDPQNRVKRYKPNGQAAPAQKAVAAPARQAASAQAAKPAGSRPWARPAA